MAGCKQYHEVLIINNSDFQLENKQLTLFKAQLSPEVGEYILIKNPSGDIVPIQFDDMDGDGNWDEVVFQYSFEKNDSVHFIIETIDSTALPQFEQKTDAYLGYSPDRNGTFNGVRKHSRPSDHKAKSTPYLYQYEGPGWESELVAFRLYFDERNGKDIFGKTKKQLHITQMGLGEDYHKLQDWGMDILKVGNSLGAGGIAILKNDSLYRLGETDQASFKIISKGAVRSILQLTYEGWHVDGQSYSLTETISIWAGSRSYQSSLQLSPENDTDTLVTGIVDLKGASLKKMEQKNSQILYTYGQQSENNDALGLGLIIPQRNYVQFDEAPTKGAGVTHSYLAYLKADNKQYNYQFFAGWQGENEKYKNQEAFEQDLKSEAISNNTQVQIKIFRP
jgi:hypothetical protein